LNFFSVSKSHFSNEIRVYGYWRQYKKLACIGTYHQISITRLLYQCYPGFLNKEKKYLATIYGDDSKSVSQTHLSITKQTVTSRTILRF